MSKFQTFQIDLGLLGIAEPVLVNAKEPPASGKAAPREIDARDLGIPTSLVLMGTPFRCRCCEAVHFHEIGIFAEIRYRSYTDYTPLTPANAFPFSKLPRRRESLTEQKVDFCPECWDFDELVAEAFANRQAELQLETITEEVQKTSVDLNRKSVV